MKLNPEDVVVLIIAITIGLFIIAVTAKSLLYEAPMAESRVKILDNLLKSFTHIVAMYIGFKLNNKK
jgi:uncharacterized protein YacL